MKCSVFRLVIWLIILTTFSSGISIAIEPGAVNIPDGFLIKLPFSGSASVIAGYSPSAGSSFHKNTNNPTRANDYYALDFGLTRNTPVLAIADGTVRYAGWSGGGWASYGQMVIIVHHNGYQSNYAHLEKSSVQVGQEVPQGKEIGLSGNSSNGAINSNLGPHLHFALYKNAKLQGNGTNGNTGGPYGGNAALPEPISGYYGIKKGQVLNSDNPPPPPPNGCPTITAWKGEYWNNQNLNGNPVLCRDDGRVDFDWGNGGPGGGVPNDHFSARWTRQWSFTAGRYRFHLRGDDGIRLWVDDNLIIDQWKDQSRTEYTTERELTGGNHSLKVEYYENGGDANVALWWDFIEPVSEVAKITGPWLWMIAPTDGPGGAVATDADQLAKASGGAITEEMVARNSVRKGDRVGNLTWVEAEISATGINNIQDMINQHKAAWGGDWAKLPGDINDHSAYALITIKSQNVQNGVTARVGSDDSIKVWLNGAVVHKNSVDRGAGNFQDTFKMNLKAGNNLLLVKVSERGGDWSMFVGIQATFTVEPEPTNISSGERLEINPSNWDSASSWWEQYGPSYEGNPAIANWGATHTHAYGYAVGQLTYHFPLSNVAGITAAEISARLSSEFPGYSAPPDGYSDVTLIINGKSYEGKRVIPDNGSGSTYTWQIRSADLKTGDNIISFAVLGNSSYRNGLCIYYKGVASGAQDEPITIRILGNMTARLPADVNGDGVVDFIDFSIIVQAFGTSGKGLPADVNGDGVVNISDVVILAAHYGERSKPNAPTQKVSGNFVTPEALASLNLNADVIEGWLVEARGADDGSEIFRRGIAVLENLLSAIVPQKTALLPNFPNPFNPETWIPYQLREASEVKITIYDAQGRVVKRLDLGLKQAGLYRERSRAAYWDGRNEVGEPVASGIYFVELRTKGERLVRRIVLLK